MAFPCRIPDRFKLADKKKNSSQTITNQPTDKKNQSADKNKPARRQEKTSSQTKTNQPTDKKTTSPKTRTNQLVNVS